MDLSRKAGAALNDRGAAKAGKDIDMSVTGVNNILASYQYANKTPKTETPKTETPKTDFAKQLQNTAESKQSFKDMWQTRFPGAYYHTMDGTIISQGVWDRNDFPVEKFFQQDSDKSVLNWRPAGTEPVATSSQVQSRWNSTLGQKSIIVPPELEEKMKNDPELAKKVMANVENFISTYTATSVRPGRICSWLISLDENGEIEKYRVTGGGGNLVGPTEEEQRQFEAEQAAKKKRREEYVRLNEESALKRSAKWQEIRTEHYQQRIYDKVLENYEKGTFM